MGKSLLVSGSDHLKWKVHTPNLLKEVMSNPSCWALHQPVNIFKQILIEVAERAIEINDHELNKLMVRLVLYEQGDPTSKEYDVSILDKVPDDKVD